MGQEVQHAHFHKHDFHQFQHNLRLETEILSRHFTEHSLSKNQNTIGFEIEASLVDQHGLPSANSEAIIQACSDIDVSPELSQFNLEINSQPLPLGSDIWSQTYAELEKLWNHCNHHANAVGTKLVMAGILPTLEASHLAVKNMSNLKRFQALNEQVLRLRQGKPLHIDIDGQQHLISDHGNVMIEAATTSLQMHWQLKPETAHHYYNAMLIAVAPLVAASANSPLLFGKALWQETRIPLFEQSIAVHDGTPSNTLPRVTFGSGYVKESLFECFQENERDYTVLLPAVADADPESMQHLNLHNGTVWRWVRPIVGFDSDGTPHIRLEQRTTSVGPTLADCVANAALLYGLTYVLAESSFRPEKQMTFEQTKTNFYTCAQHGLQTQVQWLDGKQYMLPDLFQQQLLPMAKEGLVSMGCRDYQTWLDIIQERVSSGKNGAAWQLNHYQKHQSLTILTNAYYKNQEHGDPVHTWTTH